MSARRAIRLLAVLALPPAIAIAATMLAWQFGGQAACAAGLDLDTPGLVCAPVLVAILVGALTVAFHLVVVLPAIIVGRKLGIRGRPFVTAVCAWAAASWCAALAGDTAESVFVAIVAEMAPLATCALVAALLVTRGRSPRPRPSAP